MSVPASIYRVGVTNAADRGLDMWANFGAVIQVKHLTLKLEDAEDAVDGLNADRVLIVCLDIEKKAIESLLSQVGLRDKVQGVITLNDLHEWYSLCLGKKYAVSLGKNLLPDLRREFASEFPVIDEMKPFLKERRYDKISLQGEWEIK